MNRYKFINEGRKHLHTLDGKPLVGATTAKSIIGGKDQLMQWYADMAAISGLSLPQQDIKDEYEKVQAISDWKEKAKAKRELDKNYPDYATARRAAILSRDKSAKTGTTRHSTLEDYVNYCLESGGKPRGVSVSEYAPEVVSFVNWALDNVEEFYFTEAYCYHEPLWGGGIADLGLKLKNGKRVIADHKNSKGAYPDQFLQCAIYDTFLNHSGGLDKDGNKLFDWELADGYIVFPFRSEPFTPEFRWNAEGYRKGGEYTFALYKLLEINEH